MPRSDGVDPSKVIGQYMLQGWALLADHCPRCNTPLISKKGGDMFCCCCECKVVTQKTEAAARGVGAALPPVSPTDAVTQAEIDAFEADDGGGGGDGDEGDEGIVTAGAIPPRSYDEMRAEYDEKNKARDVISAKLGTYVHPHPMSHYVLLSSLPPSSLSSLASLPPLYIIALRPHSRADRHPLLLIHPDTCCRAGPCWASYVPWTRATARR